MTPKPTESPTTASRRLTRNRCRCRLCDTVIESKHRHDWVACKCGAVFTDGGTAYIRRGYKSGMTVDECIEDLSEYEERP